MYHQGKNIKNYTTKFHSKNSRCNAMNIINPFRVVAFSTLNPKNIFSLKEAGRRNWVKAGRNCSAKTHFLAILASFSSFERNGRTTS